MKFSLIIPIYNSGMHLAKLLDSILQQNYSSYEVVVVNDGSTDNGMKVIEEYQKKSSKIKLINIKHSGPGVARRVGFENSAGELLFFIDSDDQLPNENVLLELSEVDKREKPDILFFNFLRKSEEGEVITNCLFANNIEGGLHAEVSELDGREIASALWCKIFRRKKMKNEFFINSRNLEDCFTTYCYLNNCNNYYYFPEVCYIANRFVKDSLSKQDIIDKISESVRTIEKAYQITKYRRSLTFTVLNYYIALRRAVDKAHLEEDEKKRNIIELRKLKVVMDREVLLFRVKFKMKLKYIYYIVKDFLI